LLKLKKKGFLVVISSPSGAGKTTITKNLITKKKNIELSVSVTTRQPRKKEINNIDYSFVNKEIFKKYIKKKLFLEYAKVFDNFYGTLKSNINSKLNQNKIVLLDIDWQGARQIKQKMPKQTVTIFILPPSLKILKERLLKRERNLKFVNKRMAKAKREIMHWNEYDYVVINQNLNECISEIRKILSIATKRPINYYLV